MNVRMKTCLRRGGNLVIWDNRMPLFSSPSYPVNFWPIYPDKFQFQEDIVIIFLLHNFLGGHSLFLFLCFGGVFNIPPTPFGYEIYL